MVTVSWQIHRLQGMTNILVYNLFFEVNDTPLIADDYLPCARKVFTQNDKMPKIDIKSNFTSRFKTIYRTQLIVYDGKKYWNRAFLKHPTVLTVTTDDVSWFHCNMVWG